MKSFKNMNGEMAEIFAFLLIAKNEFALAYYVGILKASDCNVSFIIHKLTFLFIRVTI